MIERLSICGITFCLIIFGCVAVNGLAQQMEHREKLEAIDRIVAIVDEDPILFSEINQMIGLGMMTVEEGETEADLHRRILDTLIENRLRFREIARFGFSEVPFELVDDEIFEFRERLGGAGGFDKRLEGLNLGLEELRQFIAQRLMTLIYVEERLGPRIFVDLEDIQDYFEAVLKPEMERTGQEIPPIQEVREQIRAVLRERRLNEQIEVWTQELRAEADVVDYLNSIERELPSHQVER